MRTLISIVFLLCSAITQAQQKLELWPDQAPSHSKPVEDTESVDDCWRGVRCAHRITNPTLTLYPSDGDSQTRLLMMRGGGYDVVAIHHEGANIAEALSDEVFSRCPEMPRS